MVSIKSCYNLKFFFVLFDATIESDELLFFLEKSVKTFLQFDLPKKKLRQAY